MKEKELVEINSAIAIYVQSMSFASDWVIKQVTRDNRKFNQSLWLIAKLCNHAFTK